MPHDETAIKRIELEVKEEFDPSRCYRCESTGVSLCLACHRLTDHFAVNCPLDPAAILAAAAAGAAAGAAALASLAQDVKNTPRFRLVLPSIVASLVCFMLGGGSEGQ